MTDSGNFVKVTRTRGPTAGDIGGMSTNRYELVLPATDAVTTPSHYLRFKIEPIKFIEENGLPFAIGNVIKYVCRYDAKDGVQDLKKARRYLDMLIKRLEGDAEWNT